MELLSMQQFIDFDLVVTEIWNCSEKQCPLNWNYEEKNGRVNHGIVLVLDGKADYYSENSLIQVEKGDVILLPKGGLYRTRGSISEPYHFIVSSFNINHDSQPFIFTNCNVSKLRCNPGLSSQFQELSRQWFYKGIAYKLKCTAILTDILFQIIRNSIQEAMNLKNYSRIQSAISYMEHYYERDTFISELAEMSCLSESQFRRIFKEIFNTSPVEYLNYIRVNKAKDLIMSEMYSISEIAEKLGYPSVYYFSRVFKKYTGVSPKNYEKF